MDGTRVLGGRYRLLNRLGAGGMGEVWKADDTLLHRDVAIKTLHPNLAAQDAFRDRFQREARTVAALRHPGIVDLFDICEERSPDGVMTSYLVMEYVSGRSLSSILDEFAPLTVEETFSVIGSVAEALAAAHASGVVHRDIKPDNILVHRDGSATIVDFGIARKQGDASLTTTGAVMCTVTYASPEQLQGQALTGASDLYSLGVIAYECLAGAAPFDRSSPAAVIAGHLNDAPPALPGGIPSAVADLVARALEKDARDRFPDASGFARACESVLGRRRDPGADYRRITVPLPVTPTAIAPIPQPVPVPGSASTDDRSRPRRRWLTFGLAAVAVVAGTASAIVWWPASNGADADDGRDGRSSSDDSPVPEPTGAVERPADSVLVNASSLDCLLPIDGDGNSVLHMGLCDGSTDETFRFDPAGEHTAIAYTDPGTSTEWCVMWNPRAEALQSTLCETVDDANAWDFTFVGVEDGVDVWHVRSVRDPEVCLGESEEVTAVSCDVDDRAQLWRTTQGT
ncbi:serine/threonine-protein kinase [Stackebrandtia soli]|uniref:serine/threonine-protein kinase n=1 Tax=Stackebrandtia soli TaxID=1892856 RepID=UPI0039ED6BC7